MKLEKAAKKFEGARSPYMLGTGKKAWYRKEGNKWKYDSMVTPAEEKDWEEAWAKKKKLKEMKAKTAEKETKLKAQAQQLQQLAAAKRASGPSKAEIEAAGTRSKLYYEPTTSERARKLCDMTGILCLDKTAEDYVEGNLRTVFELSTDQKRELRGMNPMYPLDTDGRFSEDPLFMEDTLNALRKYKKDVVNTGKWKDDARAHFISDYIADGNTQADAENVADYIVQKEEEYLKKAVDEWIDAIERHENDKILVGKMRTLEQSVTGARVLDILPTVVPLSIVPEMYDPNRQHQYGQVPWSDLTDQAKSVLNTLGISELVYSAREFGRDRERLDMFIFCAMNPEMVDMLEPYFLGATVSKPIIQNGKQVGTGSEWVPGGANVQSPQSYKQHIGNIYTAGMPGYWDYRTFKNGAAILQKKYAAQSDVTKKIVAVENKGVIPEYEWNERPNYSGGTYDYSEGTIHDRLENFLTGVSSKYSGGKGASAIFKDQSWSELVDVSRNLAKFAPPSTPEQDTAALLRAVQETGKVMGNTLLSNTADIVDKQMEGYYKHLSTPMKEQVLYDKDRLVRAFSEVVKRDEYKISMSTSGSFKVPDSGFIGYKLVRRHAEYGVAYAGQRRRRYSTRNSGVTEKFGENAMLKNALKQKFFMSFSTFGKFSRERYSNDIVHSEHHAGASILATIATNWQIRKLAKKAQVLPDWRWGDTMPYKKSNPLPVKGDNGHIGSRDFPKATFEKLVTDARNTSIAANIGLMKKELKQATTQEIRKPTIVIRTSQKSLPEWQQKIDEDWTHDHPALSPSDSWAKGSIVVKRAFDVMYHPYYSSYKELEGKGGPVGYGYHGTNFQIGAKIIKGGYKNSSSGMFGPYQYETSSSSKAAAYLGGGVGSFSRHGVHGVLLLNRIALGRINDGSDPHGAAYDQNIDTVYARGSTSKGIGTRGGGRVLHDEWAVKDPKRVVPIAWLDVATTDIAHTV